MSSESTISDLAELAQRFLDALNARDIDAAISVYGPDSVWDLSSIGLGLHEGPAAIRGFLEEWTGTFEDWKQETEQNRDLGNRVTFTVVVQRGRPHGSSGWVQLRYAVVTTWAGGLVERQTHYADIDEARAAAERLAEERG
jgi:ketosteroid isomerase-like protein